MPNAEKQTPSSEHRVPGPQRTKRHGALLPHARAPSYQGPADSPLSPSGKAGSGEFLLQAGSPPVCLAQFGDERVDLG